MSTSVATPARPMRTSLGLSSRGMVRRFDRDPAVIEWHIALSPIERPRREHWWRELVTATYRDWRDAWEALRESEPYLQHELEEFKAEHPPPTLKAAMLALQAGRRGHW